MRWAVSSPPRARSSPGSGCRSARRSCVSRSDAAEARDAPRREERDTVSATRGSSEDAAAVSGPPPELSVVVPVYDEEAVLPELHRRLKAVMTSCAPNHEILYVDDGSHDQSPTILLALAASDPRVRVLRFSRNFGHQAAVTAGIEYARGAAVVIID